MLILVVICFEFFLSTPNFWQYQNPQEEIHNEMNSGTKIYFCILRNHIEFLMDDFKLMQIIHYGGCDSGKNFFRCRKYRDKPRRG